MKIPSLIFIFVLIFVSRSFKLQKNFQNLVLISVKQNQCVNSTPSKGCVWLYKDFATKVEVCDNTPSLATLNFDKLPLAVRLGNDTKVTLFSNYNYSGNSRVYNTSGRYQLLDFLCQTSSVFFKNKETYTIRGYIKNALTGKVFASSDLGSVSINFTDSTGAKFPTTIIASNSTYYVQLPSLGKYSRNGTMTGKVPTGTTIDVTSSSDESAAVNTVYFSEVVKGWRAVLSWNTKQDLDTYVITPSNSQVWYKNKTDGGPITLDVDDRTGAGPETLTFNFTSTSSGSYRYYINSYSKLPLNISESKVVVYHGAYQIAELTPPSGTALAFWYVFRIDANKGTEQYVEINKYVSSLSST